MKSLLSSSFWKTAQLIIPLSLIIGSSTIAQAKDRNPLFCGLIRPGGSDYPAGSSRGYLTVYLRADQFYDGNAWYFPQNLFAIYTIDGKLFKNVTSQLFRGRGNSRGRGAAGWILHGRCSIGEGRIYPPARCHQGGPANGSRPGSQARGHTNAISAKLTAGESTQRFTKDRLNGFGLKAALLAKHAQHPVVIHFPIALFIISVAFDLLAIWRSNQRC